MKTLLLVAHGSRRDASNDEVRCVASRLREQADKHFAYVSCAFLELAEPSIPDGIQECIDQGASSVEVLPYFLSAGRHVSKDIPQEVASMQQKYPEIPIQIRSYLGSSEQIPSILLQLVLQAGNETSL